MRASVTLAAVVALAVTAVAAPALTLGTYRPEPRDFELAAPAVAPGGGVVLSRPLRAPARFNLVGLRWTAGGAADVAVRVRRDGGRWSAWRSISGETEDAPDEGSPEDAAALSARASSRTRPADGRSAGGVSAPAWAGQADWAQYRTSRPLGGVRLHFVNTTGSATAADRARTTVRRLANRALLAVAGTPAARAQGARPEIVPRADWGAEDCRPRKSPSYGEVKAALVHHTVSANDYTPEEAPAAVLAICRYHRNSNRWNDIGYNFVVDTYGTIYEGRAGGTDRSVVGAQAQGYNSQTTGIANLGTYTDIPQSDSALNAIAALVRWKLPLHGQPTSGEVAVTSAGGSANRYPAGAEVILERVSGHRDTGRTACPGNALYAQLPDLRGRVGGLAPRRPRTRIEASVTPTVVSFAQRARVSGRLRMLKGDPLGGAPVQIQYFRSGVPGEWITLTTTHTASDGSFQALIAPPGKRVLRARFPGDPERVNSTSRQAVVKVRPLLTARRSVSRARTGQTPVIDGSIRPAKAKVALVVERHVGSRNLRVARINVRAKGGRLRKAVRFKRPGLYRFRYAFGGDSANLAVGSNAVFVRVAKSSGGSSAR